jgi:HK97 family phage portal protein
MRAHGGKRGIAVLNATTDFQPIAITPLDAQLDKAREWSLRDVALAFGVPGNFLGIRGDSDTYANIESRFIELRTYTLLPWIARIEANLDALFPAGTGTHIVTAGLERGDTATRYAAYEKGLAMGLYTVDEVRALENLPPLGAPTTEGIPQ